MAQINAQCEMRECAIKSKPLRIDKNAAAYKAGVEAYNDFIHGNIGITSESITLKDFMANWLDNVAESASGSTTIKRVART
ncbi:MAG: hypothetical protein IKG61_05315 [Selenomonadaceae bacterium]|nr:hypothetical protein [Selenomonadaceae bacterium]